MPFHVVARRDKDVANLRKTAKHLAKIIPIDKYMNEVESLHKRAPVARIVRRNSPITGRLLQRTSFDIQGNRSRLVGIKLSCLRHKTDMEILLTKTKKLIRFRYAQALRQDFKTQDERYQAIGYLLEPVESLIARLGMIVNHCDIVIGDLDQSSWSVKHSIEAVNQDQKGNNI